MALIDFNQKSHRLIASVYPPTGVFDEFGNAEDVLAAMELEGMTNDRQTGALGRLNSIPEQDWTVGESGSNMAMAAFLHPSPGGGRFNTENLGAWYASIALETAMEETLYHHTRRLKASDAGFPNTIQMRELISHPKAQLHDLISDKDQHREFYKDQDYSASQAFGEDLRKSGQDGIMYESVRHIGGKNIVIFKPKILVPVVQGDHYNYSWDASGTHSVAKITNVK